MKNLFLTFSVLSFSFLSQVNAAYQCSQIFHKEMTFGPEFTVTNESIRNEGNANPKEYGFKNNPIKKEYYDKLIESLKNNCAKTPGCKEQFIPYGSKNADKHGDSWMFKFENDFYIRVGIDSCAIEVNTPPFRSISQYKKLMPLLEGFFFRPASEIGLLPHHYTGGNHNNIGRPIFEESSLSYMNFSTDFQNRPEVAMLLGRHLGNAAPLSALKSHQRDAYRQLVETFNTKRSSIDDFIQLTHSKVFTEGYVAEWGSPNYYQIFNQTRMKLRGDAARLELRYAPQTPEQYMLSQIIHQTWINKVKNQTEVLPYQSKAGENFSPQQQVDAFAQLLSELGLPYDMFKPLLPANMRNIRPRENVATLPYDISGLK